MSEAEPDKVAEVALDAKQRLEDSMAWALGTEQGRRLLFHLSAAPVLDRNAFTGEELSRDYNLGQQAQARWLMAVLERVDPDLFDKMVSEGLRERRNDRVHAQPDASP